MEPRWIHIRKDRNGHTWARAPRDYWQRDYRFKYCMLHGTGVAITQEKLQLPPTLSGTQYTVPTHVDVTEE